MTDAPENKTNIGLLVAFTISTMIGIFNFGFSLASWNMFQTPFKIRLDWDEEETTKWSVALTVFLTFGLMTGSITSSYLMTKSSKWTLLMIMNLILILGTGLTFIDHMEIITVGKFLCGYAVGGMSVYCPMMLNELVPIELKGSFLSMTQVSVGLGIFSTSLFGLAIPENPAKESFYVQEYWRWVWGFQIFLALVQVVLLLTVLNSDTPVELKARGDSIKLTQLMKRIYTEN